MSEKELHVYKLLNQKTIVYGVIIGVVLGIATNIQQ